MSDPLGSAAATGGGGGDPFRRDEAAIGDATHAESVLPQDTTPDQRAPITTPNQDHEEVAVAADEVAAELEELLNREDPDLSVLPQQAGPDLGASETIPIQDKEQRAPAAATDADYAKIEELWNNEDNDLKITPERVDTYAANLEAEIMALAAGEELEVEAIQGPNVELQWLEDAIVSGQFSPEVVDSLVQAHRWDDLIRYLKNGVVLHAADCVVPPPDGATADELVVLHAELFLSAHKPHVLELITDPDDGTARGHFNQHLQQLRVSVPEDRQWLRHRFNLLDQIVDSPQESSQEAALEIKDYMFLYFPVLRPVVPPVRGKAQSAIWRYGEKVWRADGETGFRCFSCHKVYWGSKVGRLRTHLQGGDAHQAHCPAVLPCILQSLALIP